MRQRLCVGHFRGYATRTRRGRHLRRCVNSHYLCAGCRNPLRKLSVAAAKVENALAGLSGQPLQHTVGQLMHKRAIAAIRCRIPCLRHSNQPPGFSLKEITA
jgi:hypothetical protein